VLAGDASERGRGEREKGKRSAAKGKAGARRLGSLSRSGASGVARRGGACGGER
jgi:hypothetical protein